MAPASLSGGSTVGATLVMLTVAVSVLLKPPWSVTRRLTVIEPGPSRPAALNVGVAPVSSPRAASSPGLAVDAVAIQVPGVSQGVAGIGVAAACAIESHAAAFGDVVGAVCLGHGRAVGPDAVEE